MVLWKVCPTLGEVVKEPDYGEETIKMDFPI
jgi:hypothetical protein